jgi:hypothetical protein
MSAEWPVELRGGSIELRIVSALEDIAGFWRVPGSALTRVDRLVLPLKH